MDIMDRLFIQQQYVGNISTYLDGYKMVRYSPFKAVCRCSICGDSATRKRVKRGAFMQMDYSIRYMCKNCGASFSFDNYMKQFHPGLFNEYLFEVLKNKPKDKPKQTAPVEKKVETPKFEPLSRLPLVKDSAVALQYCKNRLLTDEMLSDIYFTSSFYEWVNTVVPDKFDSGILKYDHARIVIPLRDIMGSVIGFQGRTISDSVDAPKYLTIMLNDLPKIWGLDRIDYNKRVYVYEGPLDAMFMNNSVAMAGIDGNISFKDFVFVLDNQPRNPDVLNTYDKYITLGHKIVIWPQSLKFKDINDMIKSGMTVSDVQRVIDTNTFSGMTAKQKFNFWRKV